MKHILDKKFIGKNKVRIVYLDDDLNQVYLEVFEINKIKEIK